MNGILMAIGGFDGTTYLKTCEIFDPDTNVWKLSGSMIYRRLGGGVGVVKMTKEASTGCMNNSLNESRTQSTNMSITSKMKLFFTVKAKLDQIKNWKRLIRF